MHMLKMCTILLCCNIYAGQIINPTHTSLYELCIRELAKPGTDNRSLPHVIRRDIYRLQIERFVEHSRAYEQLRERALQEETVGWQPYSAITKEAIAFAYKHFSTSNVSCSTEIARGCVSTPNALCAQCTLQTICLGSIGIFYGGIFLIGALPYAIAPPLLLLKGAKFFVPAAIYSCCGWSLGMSSHTFLKKQCLDAALPHYNAPQTLRMHLDILENSLTQREQFPVDEDIEDAPYDERAALLR